MFRRLLAAVALSCTVLSFAPSTAGAETSGGTDTTTRSAMGKIAGGGTSNCVIINSDGQVACWGENSKGQLGVGDTDDRTTPASIPGLFASQIAVSNGTSTSAFSACAILLDTSVKCWGYNAYGGLGNGTQVDSLSPVNVCAVGGCGSGNLTGAKAISVGFGFACAILADDSVACWGYNSSWRLGVDPNVNYMLTTPVAVPNVSNATQISSSFGHTCAIISDLSLKCWGEGGYGQLGLGDGNNSSRGANTVTASGISGVKAVTAMMKATCAIVTDNSVKCWGSNYNYDSSTTEAIHNTPATMQIGASTFYAKALESGTYGACAIKTNDALVCWGSLEGRTGSATAANMSTANIVANVVGMSSVTSVAVGSNSVCVTAPGLKCWGSSLKPVLGNALASADSVGTAVDVVVPNGQTATMAAISNKTTASGANTLSGSSSSGQPLSYASDTPSVCAVTNPSWNSYAVVPIGPGTCSVTGTAPGGSINGTYYYSATATVTFTITAVTPVVTLNTASAITISSATISASVNPALSNTMNVFKYSRNADLSNATSVPVADVGSGAGATTLSTDISGLPSGTTYYYTIVSTNTVGTTTATTKSFSTIGYPPIVTTGSPTSVSAGRATLNAVVTPGGVSTTIWFTIGQKSDLSDGTKIDYRELSDLTAIDVSVSASNLVESTRYYYRVEATNFLGSAKGEIKSFTAARPVGISVNNAAEFTNKKSVTIYATGPSGSTQVIISNDGGFGSSQTFSLTDSYAEIPWTLVASRDERLPKTVYARFVQRFGTQSSTNTDDIILDTTAPTMTSASGAATSTSSENVTVQGVRIAAAKGAVKITVKAKDTNSGIGTVQVKGSSGGSPVDVTTGSPKATSRTIKVNTTKKKLWVRVVDRAGNTSKWVTVTVK